MTKFQNKFKLLFFLSLISGICGLSYEILYVHLISNYFGNIFYISAAVLTTFFLGMGIGSIYSYKFSKHLPYLEMGIGVYALIITTIFYTYSSQILNLIYSNEILGPFLITITTIIILIVPAVLLGFSVPLYTGYINYYKQDTSKVENFKSIYII